MELDVKLKFKFRVGRKRESWWKKMWRKVYNYGRRKQPTNDHQRTPRNARFDYYV